MPPLGRIPPNREPIGTTVVSDKVIPTYLHDDRMLHGSYLMIMGQYLQVHRNTLMQRSSRTADTHSVQPSPTLMVNAVTEIYSITYPMPI